MKTHWNWYPNLSSPVCGFTPNKTDGRVLDIVSPKSFSLLPSDRRCKKCEKKFKHLFPQIKLN